MAGSNGGTNFDMNFGTFAEAHVAHLSVDDIIRAAKVAGVRLTDSDVVAIACAQGTGGRWGTCLSTPDFASSCHVRERT